MRVRLEKRLQELKAEFDKGQRQLADLEAQASSMRETMLRISGAIQVLEEELAKMSSPDRASPAPAPSEDEQPSEKT